MRLGPAKPASDKTRIQMKLTPSHKDIASSFALWGEYLDTMGLTSKAEFEAMSLDERIAEVEKSLGKDLSLKGAFERLEAAGYDATISHNDEGLFVSGDDWEAFFSAHGQDHDTFSGDVPSEVHDLATWDEPLRA